MDDIFLFQSLFTLIWALQVIFVFFEKVKQKHFSLDAVLDFDEHLIHMDYLPFLLMKKLLLFGHYMLGLKRFGLNGFGGLTP